MPKLEKATDHNHKLISSEGGQDTSACKIWAHSPHAFSRKCPKTTNLTRFTKSNSAKIKKKKATDRNHKVISSEDAQDTSACKIWAHSLHIFSRKCPETTNLTRFTKSKWCQNKKKQQTVTINWSILKVVKIHQHTKFQPISSTRSPGNARKPQIWPISLSQSDAKRRNINRPWP